MSAYKYGYYESQDKNLNDYFKSWEKKMSLKTLSISKSNRKGIDYITYTYTDTNSMRLIKEMNALHGQMRYSVVAYMDTLSGNSDFVGTFFNKSCFQSFKFVTCFTYQTHFGFHQVTFVSSKFLNFFCLRLRK